MVGDRYQPAPGSVHLILIISFNTGKETVQEASPAHKLNTETEDARQKRLSDWLSILQVTKRRGKIQITI